MRQIHLLVTGVVQGVGFRPFCVRTARALGLRGTVRNTSKGVEIVLEGDDSVAEEYIRLLWEEPPSAAVVSNVEVHWVSVARWAFSDFSVVESLKSADQRVLIPSDLAVCEDCLAEMRDSKNRRYRYPFINCTACGPRYTIIEGLPYDRPGTTMRDFPLCPDCEEEYHNPADRRYHAQPNACPVCGPEVWLADVSGRVLCRGDESILRLGREIASGALVAVKGIGGFHVACLPEDEPVQKLRFRKKRPDKPFALMARDLESAERLVRLTPMAKQLLTGVQRPVVLCPAESGAAVSPFVAPGQRRLGVMLPYAPLHHLLLETFDALIMTSANLSDEPIVSSNEEAFSTLSGIVDFVLCHNRGIYTPIDDSVVLPSASRKNFIFLRRARGYVPNPVSLSDSISLSSHAAGRVPDILAAGAHLKSTWALTRREMLFPGQYLGDLDQLGTATYYRRSLEHFIRLYEVEPKVLAFDKHPNYTATGLARAFCGEDVALYPVQHHHAHLASVLLDCAFHSAPVIGVILDGTGYGDDGTIWGGEFLVGDARDYRRAGSFFPFRLLGGERAIREPWRCAAALLQEIFGEEAVRIVRELWRPSDVPRPVLSAIPSILPSAPVTTSCGRLFDGISALLNLCLKASYDGQAAMALENEGVDEVAPLPFELLEEKDFLFLDWRRAVKALVSEGGGEGKKAGAFHRGLSLAICDLCDRLREKTGIGHVALSGGVWQNRLLLDLTCAELEKRGFTALTHRGISPNDEGVSAGQALVAACRVMRDFASSGAYQEKSSPR
ncbi:MAG: carbamoyltransferase HypF [Synergistaceae bacterium]|nr:carbamoyltransferase HypF [Synergistaceae bacterium]